MTVECSWKFIFWYKILPPRQARARNPLFWTGGAWIPGTVGRQCWMDALPRVGRRCWMDVLRRVGPGVGRPAIRSSSRCGPSAWRGLTGYSWSSTHQQTGQRYTLFEKSFLPNGSVKKFHYLSMTCL